jgi:acylglycerol lipase
MHPETSSRSLMEQIIEPGIKRSPTYETETRPFKEMTIHTMDNLNLHAWHVAANKKTIGNIIIVHGFKDYSERYLDFAQRLAGEGYEVYGFDMRGHGKSEGDRVFFESIDVVMHDFKAAIKLFKKIDNNKPWILMGHSAGAALTARYALDFPKDLNAFILSAPALMRSSNINFVLEGAVRLVSSLAPHLKMVDLPNKDFSRSTEVVESLSTDPWIENIKIPARTATVMLDNMDYVHTTKRKNKLPFLVIHSQMDKINNVGGAKDFYAGTPTSPLQEKIIYSSFAHDLLHEPEHVQIENDILKWLKNFNTASYS